MNEWEYRTCADPDALLRFCLPRGSARQSLLFGCACCQRIRELLPDEDARSILDRIELGADGALPREDFAAALRAISNRLLLPRAPQALRAVWHAWNDPEKARSLAAKAAADGLGERHAQCRLLRDLHGDPFRPHPINPAWRTWRDGMILQIAREIYTDRRFHEMPILGDALEEAGCRDAAILDHCWQGEEHARGCWVLDALLGIPLAAWPGQPGTRTYRFTDAAGPSQPPTPWTIRAPRAREESFQRLSCHGSYARVGLRIEPMPESEHPLGAPVVFHNRSEGQAAWEWAPAVEDGVRRFLNDQEKVGKRIVEVRVTLNAVRDHPIDTNPHAVHRATVRALEETFAEVGVPVAGDESET